MIERNKNEEKERKKTHLKINNDIMEKLKRFFDGVLLTAFCGAVEG